MNVAQSYPTLCDPMTAAFQASLFMEFSRQEYWSGLPFPLHMIFPTQGSNSRLLQVTCIVGRFFTTSPPGKTLKFNWVYCNFYFPNLTALV